jgi:hypothetical protein
VGDSFLMLVPCIERIPSGFGGVGRFHRIRVSAARVVSPSSFRGNSPRGALAADLNALPPSEIGFPFFSFTRVGGAEAFRSS